jgi:hypothetical protein
MTTMNREMWVYSEDDWASPQTPMAGYSVEARRRLDRQDRRGHLRHWRQLHRRRHRAVDLRQEGHAARRVITRVDRDDETLLVSVSNDEIKNSPEFDEHTRRDEAYRGSLGS